MHPSPARDEVVARLHRPTHLDTHGTPRPRYGRGRELIDGTCQEIGMFVALAAAGHGDFLQPRLHRRDAHERLPTLGRPAALRAAPVPPPGACRLPVDQ